MGCACEFGNVGNHSADCILAIPLIKRLEVAKERAIARCDFEAAAAIRDAVAYIRKVRSAVTALERRIDRIEEAMRKEDEAQS